MDREAGEVIKRPPTGNLVAASGHPVFKFQVSGIEYPLF
jgi:hypothetical protein